MKKLNVAIVGHLDEMFVSEIEEVNHENKILTFKDKRLHLYLIEAKKQNHSSQTDSINALKDKVNRLNFRSEPPTYETISGIKGAYCHLIIS